MKGPREGRIEGKEADDIDGSVMHARLSRKTWFSPPAQSCRCCRLDDSCCCLLLVCFVRVRNRALCLVSCTPACLTHFVLVLYGWLVGCTLYLASVCVKPFSPPPEEGTPSHKTRFVERSNGCCSLSRDVLYPDRARDAILEAKFCGQ